MSEWQCTPLGEITFESKERRGDTIGLSRVYGVDRHEGLTPAAKYQSKDLGKYKLLKPGMFAYNPMRLNIGSIAYCAEEHGVGLVSPDYVVFGCNDLEVDPEFFRYLIEGPDWKLWTTAAGVGSVRVRIYYKELARMPLTIPLLPEQRAIVSVLSALDDKIELNRQMNATLESIAQAIFKSWFVDFDPVRAKLDRRKPPGLSADTAEIFPATFDGQSDELIPSGWRVVRIIDLAEINYGNNLPGKDLLASGVPVYGAGGQVGYYSEAMFGGPVTLVTSRGSGSGAVHQTYGPSFVTNNSFTIIPRQEWLGRHYLRHALMNADILSLVTGSAQPQLTIANFSYLDLIEPTKEVTMAFDEIVDRLWVKGNSNRAESKALASLRDTILPKLLSGEIRVGDAEKQIAEVV